MNAGMKSCPNNGALAMASAFVARILACVLACILASVVVSAVCAVEAFAADSYSISFKTVDCPKKLQVGDTFVVEQVVSADDRKPFPVYALSTVISFDEKTLKLLECKATGSAGDVYSDSKSISFNLYSRALSGLVVNCLPFLGQQEMGGFLYGIKT